MKWKILINDKDNYIEVITSGIADGDGSLNMAKDIAHTMRTHRIKNALIDHRNIESVIGNTTDVYHRPKVFRLIGAIMRIKIAEIIKPEHVGHFKFLETVCFNQGYQISVFQDKDKALAWLLD
ncbi:hypothetical protein JW835_09550 [bacterium]|nr:hypothetical protein [bacterium]